MARMIDFRDLNFGDPNGWADVTTIAPEPLPIIINEPPLPTHLPPLPHDVNGNTVLDIVPHALRIPPLGVYYNDDPLYNGSSGGSVLMTMTGNGKPLGSGAVNTSNTNTPVSVPAITDKLQTLAQEKPLLFFGAIGLGLYFLLKDKK